MDDLYNNLIVFLDGEEGFAKGNIGTTMDDAYQVHLYTHTHLLLQVIWLFWNPVKS